MDEGLIESGQRQPERSARFCFVLLIASAAVMLVARLHGPSTLHRFDQPRTVSYTADIIINGRWLLPRDMLGGPATKPPLVNWLAAPVVALGFWTEWAAKWPMIAATLATTALCAWMALRLFRQIPEVEDVKTASAISGIAWLVNPAGLTMLYHCRPDPVLVTVMTTSWILGTRIVCEKNPPPALVILGFWISVGLAALTKGPAAIVSLLYVPLAARLIGGRWSLINRSSWWWGLPLALAIFCAWAIPVAIIYPKTFSRLLVGQELIAQALGLGRQFGAANIESGGPLVAFKLIWENPLWFVQRFAPWSLLTISALWAIPARQWFRHQLAPAILYLLLVLAFFALSAHKTADYILPAYPAAAILAAYFCAVVLKRLRIQLWLVATAGFALAVALGIAAIHSKAGNDRADDNLKMFAHNVNEIVHDDPVVFVKTGFNTLQFFLHRHQGGGAPTPEQVAQAKWVIMPELNDVTPQLRSQPVPELNEKRFVLALYRIESVRGHL